LNTLDFSIAGFTPKNKIWWFRKPNKKTNGREI